MYSGGWRVEGPVTSSHSDIRPATSGQPACVLNCIETLFWSHGTCLRSGWVLLPIFRAQFSLRNILEYFYSVSNVYTLFLFWNLKKMKKKIPNSFCTMNLCFQMCHHCCVYVSTIWDGLCLNDVKMIHCFQCFFLPCFYSSSLPIGVIIFTLWLEAALTVNAKHNYHWHFQVIQYMKSLEFSTKLLQL